MCEKKKKRIRQFLRMIHIAARSISVPLIAEAFSASEKSAIPTVTLSNPDNPNYGTEGGNDTQDQVFLLSLEELQQYFNVSETWTDYDGNNYDDTHLFSISKEES